MDTKYTLIEKVQVWRNRLSNPTQSNPTHYYLAQKSDKHSTIKSASFNGSRNISMMVDHMARSICRTSTCLAWCKTILSIFLMINIYCCKFDTWAHQYMPRFSLYIEFELMHVVIYIYYVYIYIYTTRTILRVCFSSSRNKSCHCNPQYWSA